MKTESNVIKLQQPTLEERIKEALAYRKQANTTIPLEAEIRVGELFVQLRMESDGYEKFLCCCINISGLGQFQIYRLLKLGIHADKVRDGVENDGVNSVSKAYALVKDLPDPEGYKPPQQKRGRKPGTKNKPKVERTGWVKMAKGVGLVSSNPSGKVTKPLREELESRLGYSVHKKQFAIGSDEAKEVEGALLEMLWEKKPSEAEKDADRLEAALSEPQKKKGEKFVTAKVCAIQAQLMADAAVAKDKIIDDAVGKEKQQLAGLRDELSQRERKVREQERSLKKIMAGVVPGIDDMKASFRILKQVAHPDKFSGKPETAEKAMGIIKKLESAFLK